MKRCRDEIASYLGLPGIQHHLDFLEKKKWDFSFWIIAENKLCDQQKWMIRTRFVHRDNNSWILEA